jgi:hypothetical protein
MREELKKQYSGQYVAVYGERVVDFDANRSALIKRFYKTYGNVPVCIDKVEEDETVLEVLTPLEVIE